MTEKKTTLIPAVAAKNRASANLTRHFHGGHRLRKAARYSSLSNLVMIFIWIDKLLSIQWKTFECSTWQNPEMLTWLKNRTQGIKNSENVYYLHWRLVADYQGHVTTYFMHSMSNASLLQGPDM